jgi:chemotaxis protein methyltransferase CheR
MELDYRFFYDWVYKSYGLTLDAYKDAQMQRRIASVMRKAGARNLKEYSELIKNNDSIRNDFFDQVTINVTEFFRNKDKFEEFQQTLTEKIIPKFKNIKVWSAACSNGAEPYTVGMILHSKGVEKNSRIIASDIDVNILDKAKLGQYPDRDLKNLDSQLLTKYFSKDGSDFTIKENIKKLVSFKRHDLINDKYEKDFHAIICRNVTIYFKNDVRNEIYHKFSEALVPGGIFFIGATEGIYNPGEFGFKKLTTSIYEKI